MVGTAATCHTVLEQNAGARLGLQWVLVGDCYNHSLPSASVTEVQPSDQPWPLLSATRGRI